MCHAVCFLDAQCQKEYGHGNGCHTKAKQGSYANKHSTGTNEELQDSVSARVGTWDGTTVPTRRDTVGIKGAMSRKASISLGVTPDSALADESHEKCPILASSRES